MREVDLETALLRANAGEPGAEHELFGLLYGELRALAERVFRSQRRSHTLQPTALVHEAYLKLARPGGRGWNDQAHFMNLAARAMRQILVNHARDRKAEKRGGALAGHRVTLSGLEDELDDRLDVLAVDDALGELTRLDERQGRVAELRLFGGLTNGEAAQVLGVSLRTVEMEWKMAKAWLSTRLRSDLSDEAAPRA
jgi:RNA polymerase sigma factor (TIGR02999 family)